MTDLGWVALIIAIDLVGGYFIITQHLIPEELLNGFVLLSTVVFIILWIIVTPFPILGDPQGGRYDADENFIGMIITCSCPGIAVAGVASIISRIVEDVSIEADFIKEVKKDIHAWTPFKIKKYENQLPEKNIIMYIRIKNIKKLRRKYEENQRS